jgi:hypothetical protein
VGWFGAAGTMYFIDPESNLTVSHCPELLPHFANRCQSWCLLVRLHYANAARRPSFGTEDEERIRETSLCDSAEIVTDADNMDTK